MDRKMTPKMHSFGKTDPNAKCYGKDEYRQPACGILVKKEFVTNKLEQVTCKRCLKLEAENILVMER